MGCSFKKIVILSFFIKWKVDVKMKTALVRIYWFKSEKAKNKEKKKLKWAYLKPKHIINFLLKV